MRQGDDELEGQGTRVIHFYIGDDDDDESEFHEVEEIDIPDDEPIVRRLGEENEDVAIFFDSGAKSVETSSHDLEGREVLLRDNVIFSLEVNQPTLGYGRLMEHGWGINNREPNVGEW